MLSQNVITEVTSQLLGKYREFTLSITAATTLNPKSLTLSTITSVASTSPGFPTVAVATAGAAHGLETGMLVTVSGSDLPGYNLALVPVTVISTTIFTYPIKTALGSSAGTPVFAAFPHARRVIVSCPSTNTQPVKLGNNSNADIYSIAAAGNQVIETPVAGSTQGTLKINLADWQVAPVSGTQSVIVSYI